MCYGNSVVLDAAEEAEQTAIVVRSSVTPQSGHVPVKVFAENEPHGRQFIVINHHGINSYIKLLPPSPEAKDGVQVTGSNDIPTQRYLDWGHTELVPAQPVTEAGFNRVRIFEDIASGGFTLHNGEEALYTDAAGNVIGNPVPTAAEEFATGGKLSHFYEELTDDNDATDDDDDLDADEPNNYEDETGFGLEQVVNILGGCGNGVAGKGIVKGFGTVDLDGDGTGRTAVLVKLLDATAVANQGKLRVNIAAIDPKWLRAI